MRSGPDPGRGVQLPDPGSRPGAVLVPPHIRETTPGAGLSGNLLVVPAEADSWPPADRELVVTVDDLLVEDGQITPFSPAETSYVAMGRSGNLFLVAGDPELRLAARAGEVVRWWLTTTANTRVVNLRVPGARLKLVGGDSGRVEHQQFIESLVLAPRSGRWSMCWSSGPGSWPWSTGPPSGAIGWSP